VGTCQGIGGWCARGTNAKHCSPRTQADGSGKELSAPTAPAGTNLAAQFSITWEDIPPSKIGELQAAAFKAAILKQLPAGVVGWPW